MVSLAMDEADRRSWQDDRLEGDRFNDLGRSSGEALVMRGANGPYSLGTTKLASGSTAIILDDS